MNHQLPKGEEGESSLPDWLPEEAWRDFVAHRKALKAPVTELSKKRLLATLEKLRAEGHDPVEVIDQSIATGKWTGLFAVKSSARRGATKPQNQHDANERFRRGVEEKRAAIAGVFDD